MLGALTILLYHGVTESKSFGIENYHAKHIAAGSFRKQMEFIAANCNVLSMDDVVTHYSNRIPFPANAVAVTFDDGYENNYTVAAPILDEFNVKATFYITTGIIDSEKMFWVDELEDCINLSKETSLTVKLDVDHEFNIRNREEKIFALETIKSYCKSARIAEKDRIVKQVRSETNVNPSVENAVNYRKIKSSQLREMASNPLFMIGGHSYEHNILTRFDSEADMQKDIERSISELKKILHKPVSHYAYPEGQTDHYNKNVIDELRRNGIICCPSAVHGINEGTENLFSLKRIMVGFKGTSFPFFSTEKNSTVTA